MRAFFAAGGRMIDSSPMYGSSQPVIGYGLKKFGAPNLFSAEKVWTSSGARGPAQIEASRKFWGVPKFDLLQVHNLLAWEEHLRTLFAMKAAGQVRYVGITTSEGRRHAEVEKIMASQPLDFVQVSYNVLDREVENRILPLARERGIAVIVNRPFREGDLVRTIMRKPLPSFAAEIGATSWAQLILKFIISHPAVTCAIPATTRVDHVQENMGAARDPLPDAAMAREARRACGEAVARDVGVVDLLAHAASCCSRRAPIIGCSSSPTPTSGRCSSSRSRRACDLVLIVRSTAWSGRAVAAILAALWLFVAWAYLLQRYDPINFAARYFAIGFALQAALLVWTGVDPRSTALRYSRHRGEDRHRADRLRARAPPADRAALRPPVDAGGDLRPRARPDRHRDARRAARRRAAELASAGAAAALVRRSAA